MDQLEKCKDILVEVFFGSFKSEELFGVLQNQKILSILLCLYKCDATAKEIQSMTKEPLAKDMVTLRRVLAYLTYKEFIIPVGDDKYSIHGRMKLCLNSILKEKPRKPKPEPKIMKWKPYPRADGRMEYLCEHGCGHGDHVHGCDSCCSRDDYPLKAKEKKP